MIPRAVPNYSIADLAGALFARESSGKGRRALTEALERLFGGRRVILAPSGRGAIRIALSSLDQRKVLVPAYTCKAAVEAVRLAGKEPVFAETGGEGFNVDPAAVEGLLDADTILLMTHQFGFPADADAMLKAAARAGSPVIEDCAASFGSKHNGSLTGTLGLAGCFSLDSSKTVNAPLKGGFIVTGDEGLHSRMRGLADSSLGPMPYPMKLKTVAMAMAFNAISLPPLYSLFHWLKFGRKGRCTDEALPSAGVPGPFYTSALGEFQARPALRQLRCLDAILARRREIYTRLRDGLDGCRSFTLPPSIEGTGWAPVRFPILVKGDKFRFYGMCVRRGCDMAFSFTYLDSPDTFARSREIASSLLDLPYYYRLSDRQADKVIRIIKDVDQEF